MFELLSNMFHFHFKISVAACCLNLIVVRVWSVILYCRWSVWNTYDKSTGVGVYSLEQLSSGIRQLTDWHPFDVLFSRTTWVSWHQKGQIILDYSDARGDEVAVESAGPCAKHLHLAPDNHASTSSLNFLQAGCFSSCPTNSVKALKANKTAMMWR